MPDEQRKPNPATETPAEPQTDAAQAADPDADDDSALDDMIESIVEIPERVVHWLFKPLWGGGKDD